MNLTEKEKRECLEQAFQKEVEHKIRSKAMKAIGNPFQTADRDLLDEFVAALNMMKDSEFEFTVVRLAFIWRNAAKWSGVYDSVIESLSSENAAGKDEENVDLDLLSEVARRHAEISIQAIHDTWTT